MVNFSALFVTTVKFNLLMDFYVACSDQSARRHLKNVYACLSASMLAAAVGSGVHIFTDMMKVCVFQI